MNREMNRREFIRTSAMTTTSLMALGLNTSSFNKEEDIIIDSHCHVWPYWPYTPEVPDPESRGTTEQLINQMNLWGINQATIVSAQIENNPDNNNYVAEAVKKYPSRLHQYADIDSVWSKTYHTPGAALRLENAFNNLPMKGFTHYLSNDDNASWFNTQDGTDFFRVASQTKLIASIACQPHHQPAIRKIAEKFPDVPILCHHLSGLKSNETSPHKNLNEVLESSKLPNIYLKLSGFAYVTDDKNKGEYPYADTHWIYKECYNKYGKRMVWGSDYPVVNFFMTYQQSLEAFRKHLSFISKEDKAAILGGTLKKILDNARSVTVR